MKELKIISVVIGLVVSLNAFTCTNFLVGKAASADGSTMISYAADSYSLYGFLRYAPAADHAEGEMREIRDWDTGKPLGQIPQVKHTYSVVGNMNEHQLTIGETTYGGREELWDTVGIDYGSLIYIALERCRTAREAIECVTDLIEQYGYASEGESFSFGDPDEIWIMDRIGKGPGRKGAVWVATRVPDDCICAHANQARTTTIPVAAKGNKRRGNKVYSKDGNHIWSRDVISFAREKGYFRGKDAEFSFQAAYAPYDFSGLYVCEARVWSFFRRFSDDMEQYFDYATGKTFVETDGKDAGTPMPLYIKPNRKVSLSDMRAAMRDQYEGTPLDITSGTDAGPWNSKLRFGGLAFTVDSVKYWYERPTATQQTGWSYVSQMRGENPVGGIFWFGVDDAATSLYMPMYCRMNSVPECLREGNGDLYTYSPTSAWWAFNEVAQRAYAKYSRIKPDIVRVQQAWEDKFDAQVPAIDARAAEMTDKDARAFLTEYSCTQAEDAVRAWKDLNIYLLVKYIDGQERKEKDGHFERNAWGEPIGPHRLHVSEAELRKIAPGEKHE